MKKKALMTILLLCVAVAMTACGGNGDTAEVKEPMVTEENAEADTEASTVDEEAVESEQTEGESPENEKSFEEIEIGADGSVNGQEFPIIDEAVLREDKSDDYGVHSISSYDIDQYIDEDGNLKSDISSGESFYYEYSGRWAYPKITPCRFFGELTLTSRIDASSMYSSVDLETGATLSFNISSGKDVYNSSEYQIGYEFEDGQPNTYNRAFTIQTIDGEQDVISDYREIMLLEEEDENGEKLDTPEEVIHGFYSYYFTVGNFTVVLQPEVKTELTQEDVQLIADNIRLTNGMER